VVLVAAAVAAVIVVVGDAHVGVVAVSDAIDACHSLSVATGVCGTMGKPRQLLCVMC
jgi:hypothetical protein